MFSYCVNNPVNKMDPSGFFGLPAFKINIGIGCTGAGLNKIVPSPKAPSTNSSASKSSISKPQVKKVSSIKDGLTNDDGSISLVDNDRTGTKKGFHDQWFLADFNYGFDLKEGLFGFALDLCLAKGGWNLGNVNLTLLQFGKASVYAGTGINHAGAGAMISAWSPEISFSNFTIGADIGAIGAEFGYKDGKLKFGLAAGIGFHISFDFG